MIIDFRIRPPFVSNTAQQTFRCLAPDAGPEAKKVLFARDRDPVPSWDQSSPELMLREMDAAGVDVGVLMGRCSENGPLPTKPNEETQSLIKKYPGRFVGFAAVEPRDQNAVAQVDFWLAQPGFKGICIDPGWSRPPLYADDEVIMPLYEHCEKHGVIVSITQSGFMGPDMSYSDPVRIQRIAKRFPALPLVLPHACWPYFHQAIFVAIGCPNVYLMPDVYFYAKGMYMLDDMVTGGNHLLKENLLFASSYPLKGFQQCLDAWRSSGLQEEALSLSLGGNAARLLGL